MPVLWDLASQHIQEGHVDELTPIIIVVHLLHSVWVALNTAECVAGHWLTGLVSTMLLWGTLILGMVLIVNTWMVCL